MKSYVKAAFAVSLLGVTAITMPLKHQLIKPIQYSRIIEVTLRVGEKKSMTLPLQEKCSLSDFFVNHWDLNTEISTYDSILDVDLAYSKEPYPQNDFLFIKALKPGTALLVFEHVFNAPKEVVGSLIYKVTILP